MKTYHDIVGDGGSNVLGQVEAQQSAIAEALSGVRHRLAIGSGKGGVGKSTVTMALARALRRQGQTVAILDADFNGPCQAQLAGLASAPWVPGENGLALPRNKDGIGIASFGSLLGEAQPFEVASVAPNEEQTWRGMREFALLGQLLGSVDWGRLDVLLFDLPPGTERTRQYAQFLGEATRFVMVTIPSDLARSVVARSISALEKNATPLLGVVENMAGYFCRDCGEVRPLFPIPGSDLAATSLGQIPFDPALASLGQSDSQLTSPSAQAVDVVARRILQALEATA
ncbi:MAG: P-loop NTPase [Acidobacteriota bacterium]